MIEEDVNMNVNRRSVIGTIAVGIVGSVSGCATGPEPNEIDVQNEGYTPELIQESEIGDERFSGRPLVGDEEAPVHVYYWNDYLCSQCKLFDESVLPEIGRRLIREGVINMRLVPYPVVSDYSTEASIWGEAVWSVAKNNTPSAYWVWRNTVYHRQSGEGTGWAYDAVFEAITEAVPDLSVDAVTEYKDNNRDEITEQIETSSGVATTLRLQGTPAFMLYNSETENTNQTVGAANYSTFRREIGEIYDFEE
jgi:protein-disulfide isomerase